MQNDIYKITLTDLCKLAHLADFIEYQSALDRIRFYLKSDLEENSYKQNHQNIKFLVSVANSIHLQENETVQVSIKYFLNLFIEKHYSYDLEYNWQQLKPVLLLVNYLETATDFKSFGKQILNPHLHSLLLKYLSE